MGSFNLKPCQFCGGVPTSWLAPGEMLPSGQKTDQFAIVCPKCNSWIRWASLDGCIDVWNKKASAVESFKGKESPCPFCGSTNVYVRLEHTLDSRNNNSRYVCSVHCNNCRATGPKTAGISFEDAINAWQNRSSETPVTNQPQRPIQ